MQQNIHNLVWTSDIHLNFVHFSQWRNILSSFCDLGDGVLVTGDIADGLDCKAAIEAMNDMPKPIYFVTGNHDYYHSSFSAVDKICNSVKDQDTGAIWLEKHGPIKLSDESVLVGVGGWADARSGKSFYDSNVRLADHEIIADLKCSKHDQLRVIQNRAKKAEEILRRQLSLAFKTNPKTVYVATHVPAFAETNLAPNGKFSDGDFLTHFNWHGLEELLVDVSEEHPEINFIHLSGHTHTGASYKRGNIYSRVASARYHDPKVEDVLAIF